MSNPEGINQYTGGGKSSPDKVAARMDRRPGPASSATAKREARIAQGDDQHLTPASDQEGQLVFKEK